MEALWENIKNCAGILFVLAVLGVFGRLFGGLCCDLYIGTSAGILIQCCFWVLGGIAIISPIIVSSITGGILEGANTHSQTLSGKSTPILRILNFLNTRLMGAYGIFQFLWLLMIGVFAHSNYSDDYPNPEASNPHANGTDVLVWLESVAIGASLVFGFVLLFAALAYSPTPPENEK